MDVTFCGVLWSAQLSLEENITNKWSLPCNTFLRQMTIGSHSFVVVLSNDIQVVAVYMRQSNARTITRKMSSQWDISRKLVISLEIHEFGDALQRMRMKCDDNRMAISHYISTDVKLACRIIASIVVSHRYLLPQLSIWITSSCCAGEHRESDIVEVCIWENDAIELKATSKPIILWTDGVYIDGSSH